MGILNQCQVDLNALREQVTRAVGEPVRLFQLAYDLEAYLLQHARYLGKAGLDASGAIEYFHSGLGGHYVCCGMTRYALEIGGESVPVFHVQNPFTLRDFSTLDEFWGVPARHYRRLYRFVRQGILRQNATTTPPVMRRQDQERLWANTIGFLKRGKEALRRFGVALKRGVLLTGEPGNGKTLAARWLQTQALSLGLEWNTVTPEEYEQARNEGTARELFQLGGAGIILFDDFDKALRNREHYGASNESSTFLAELDGVDVRSGVVYLFTSNARVEDLDPAFRRPGRIDQFLHFPRPDALLRRRLIQERWPAEIVAEIPVDNVVTSTEGCSFAEIDEVKKLLVLEFLETNRWDWPSAWRGFLERGEKPRNGASLGFASIATRAGRKSDALAGSNSKAECASSDEH